MTFQNSKDIVPVAPVSVVDPRTADEFFRDLQTPAIDLIRKEGNQPWLPLSTETPTEYVAFFVWLQQGALRPKLDSRISEVNGWSARAAAYDEWLSTQPQPMKQAASQIAESLMGTMQLAAHVVRGEIVKSLTVSHKSSAPLATLNDLTKMVEIIAKTSRLLVGESTDNVGVAVNMSRYTQEELDQMDQLVNKGKDGA